MISVTDSISGSDLGFPLVGLPGENATLLTTLKYASLLRWRPGLNVAGVAVTPEMITALYGSIVKDVPATFYDDDFSEYVALGSADPALVAQGAAQLRFNYSQLVNVASTDLVALLGLESGDILVNINGHELNNTDAMVEAYAALNQSTAFVLTINRGGTTKRLSYEFVD